MRLFSKSLAGDAAFWFRNLEAHSICSWTEFYNSFSRYWGENKSFDQYLSEFSSLKKKRNETIIEFNRRFHNIYYSMPIEIRPTEIVAMIQYTMAQHPDLFLYLKERKSPSLQQMFVDAKEVENNLQVCGKLHDQIIDKCFNV